MPKINTKPVKENIEVGDHIYGENSDKVLKKFPGNNFAKRRKRIQTASDGQTEFVFDFILDDDILVFLDGNMLTNDDYSINNETLTLNFPAFEYQKLTIKE